MKRPSHTVQFLHHSYSRWKCLLNETWKWHTPWQLYDSFLDPLFQGTKNMARCLLGRFCDKIISAYVIWADVIWSEWVDIISWCGRLQWSDWGELMWANLMLLLANIRKFWEKGTMSNAHAVLFYQQNVILSENQTWPHLQCRNNSQVNIWPEMSSLHTSLECCIANNTVRAATCFALFIIMDFQHSIPLVTYWRQKNGMLKVQFDQPPPPGPRTGSGIVVQ